MIMVKKSMDKQLKIQSQDDWIFRHPRDHIDWVPEGQTVNQIHYKAF